MQQRGILLIELLEQAHFQSTSLLVLQIQAVLQLVSPTKNEFQWWRLEAVKRLINQKFRSTHVRRRRKSTGPKSPTSINFLTSNKSWTRPLNKKEKQTCKEPISTSSYSWRQIKIAMPREKKRFSIIECKTWSIKSLKTRLTIRIRRRCAACKKKPRAWTPSATRNDLETSAFSWIRWNASNFLTHRWEMTKCTRRLSTRGVRSFTIICGICTRRIFRLSNSALKLRERARLQWISSLWKREWELIWSWMIRGLIRG